MANKYIARLDHKIVGKRTSKDRTYTHAVVAKYRDGTVKVLSWAGRLDLAMKEAARRRNVQTDGICFYGSVTVVPAELTPV